MATTAGMRPGFITGANARVKLDGLTLAYCTDLSYTVDVGTIPIEVIGTYEVKSYEPISYTVNGSFSVIRYTSKDNTVAPSHFGTAATGNPADKIGDTNNVGKQLDPGRILSSSTFDVEISQALNDGAAETTLKTYKIQNCRVTRRSSALNKRGVMTDQYQFVGIMAYDEDGTAASNSGKVDLSV